MLYNVQKYLSLFLLIIACTTDVFAAAKQYAQIVGTDYVSGKKNSQYRGTGVTDPEANPATFSAKVNLDTLSQGIEISVTATNSSSDYWYLDFKAANDETLAVKKYELAARYPFQEPTQPGLSISGQGRGCNELSGTFTVYDVAFGTDEEGNPTVKRFAANFIQYCEKRTPAMRGIIIYNSSVAVELPVIDDGTGDSDDDDKDSNDDDEEEDEDFSCDTINIEGTEEGDVTKYYLESDTVVNDASEPVGGELDKNTPAELTVGGVRYTAMNVGINTSFQAKKGRIRLKKTIYQTLRVFTLDETGIFYIDDDNYIWQVKLLTSKKAKKAKLLFKKVGEMTEGCL